MQGDIWIDCSQTLTPSLDRSLIPRDIKEEGHTMQGNIWIDFSQTLTPSLDRSLIPVTSRRRVTPCRGISG